MTVHVASIDLVSPPRAPLALPPAAPGPARLAAPLATTLTEIADWRAAQAPDAIVLRFLDNGEDESGYLTQRRLVDHARAMAGRLAKIALPGDRAVLAYPAGLDFPLAFLACLYAGIIAVPVEIPRRRSESAHLIRVAQACGATLFLTVGAVRDRLPGTGTGTDGPPGSIGSRIGWLFTDEIGDDAGLATPMRPPGAADIAYLQYTSGSTGVPRGVAISHRALLEQLDAYRLRSGCHAADMVLTGWLPHTHDFGLVGFLLTAIYLGRPLVWMAPTAFLRRPMRWLEAIARYGGSCAGGPSFGYDLCSVAAGVAPPRGDLDLSGWRIASLGGDYVMPATLDRFEQGFARFGFDRDAWLPAYGLAESILCATGRQGAVVTAFDAQALRCNSVRPAVPGQAVVRLVSSGAGMPGQQIAIVDPATRAALAENAVGEIWLGGTSLGDGYWNDSAATAARFHATLAEENGDARHVRTGDQGFLRDGELFVTGRLSDLIVIRGRNHAPDDIEQTIQAADAALHRFGGAIFQTGLQDDVRLVVVHEASRLADRDYPRLFAAIDEAVAARHGLALDAILLIRRGTIPRTRTGKISRSACAAAYVANRLTLIDAWDRMPLSAVSELSAPPAPPAVGSLERDILAKLHAMLPGRTIGVDDSAFAQGLDSLGVQMMLAWIEQRYGVALSVDMLLAIPTAAGIARLVRAGRSHRDGDDPAELAVSPPPIVPPGEMPDGDAATIQMVLKELRTLTALVAEQTRLLRVFADPAIVSVPARNASAPDAPFALTEMQREIMMLPMLDPDAETVFAILVVLECAVMPEITAVRRAARTVAARHDALRTVFEDDVQRVCAMIEPEVEAAAVTPSALDDWLRAERRRPFSLATGPLWRVTLVVVEDASYLVLTGHHLVLDGASLPILLREMAAFLADPATILPVPMQFQAFCAAKIARPEANASSADRHGASDKGPPDWTPVVDLVPTGRGHSGHAAGCHATMIDADAREALLQLGGTTGATLFETLLCAYFVLLHRVSGQERILIGIDVADRAQGPATAGEPGVIGCCNKLVSITVDFADRSTVAQLQARISSQVRQAVGAQDRMPMEWVRGRSRAPNSSRPFKINATLNMQRFPETLGGFVTRFDLEAASISQSPFGLTLDIRDTPTGLRLDFVHNRNFLEAALVERYAGYYRRLLETMCADAGADILALPMLPAEEVRRLGEWGQAPAGPSPYIPVTTQVDAQVAASPLAIAISSAEECWSYRTLQARVDVIAHAIVRHAAPGTPVALLATRGCDALAAMLAMLKTGRVYLPLDTKAPDARLAEQVALGDVGLVLHDDAHRGRAIRLAAPSDARAAIPTLDFDTVAATTDLDAVRYAGPAIAADSPAYVLFTSGSSGAPKAAMVSHRGLANHLRAKIDILGLGPGDVVAQTASHGFDIAIWQYCAALLVGGQVAVIDDAITHDAQALFVDADRRRVTVLQTVPTLLRAALETLVAPGGRTPLRALRWLISTGEALSADLCRRWISLYPRVPLLNAYGPTECSDDVTHHVAIWPPSLEQVRVPIGRPIAGAVLHVVDAGGYRVPIGTPGELWVGGPCVGLGYRNDPAQTAAAFVPDRFANTPEAIAYRTGDLVRYHQDGSLDYLGRLDGQLKIDGVRIEPGEIEAAIQRDPAVLQAHVTTRERRDGTPILVAYVVLRPGMVVVEGTLKAVARNVLPAALVPTSIMLLDRLPLTANGKIDVAALPAPVVRPRVFGGVPATTPIQLALVRIWSETIAPNGAGGEGGSGDGNFGIEDDFFDLGGRSRDAASIIRKIDGEFAVRLPLSQIFREPTIASTAIAIERRLRDRRTRTGVRPDDVREAVA